MRHRIKKFTQCLANDGSIKAENWALYRRYKRQNRKIRNNNINKMLTTQMKSNKTANYRKQPATPRHRSCYRKAITTIVNKDGTLTIMTPVTSPWYCTYVMGSENTDPKFAIKFRRRFLCNYKMYTVLLGKIKDDDLFTRWAKRPLNCYYWVRFVTSEEDVRLTISKKRLQFRKIYTEPSFTCF